MFLFTVNTSMIRLRRTNLSWKPKKKKNILISQYIYIAIANNTTGNRIHIFYFVKELHVPPPPPHPSHNRN